MAGGSAPCSPRRPPSADSAPCAAAARAPPAAPPSPPPGWSPCPAPAQTLYTLQVCAPVRPCFPPCWPCCCSLSAGSVSLPNCRTSSASVLNLLGSKDCQPAHNTAAALEGPETEAARLLQRRDCGVQRGPGQALRVGQARGECLAVCDRRLRLRAGHRHHPPDALRAQAPAQARLPSKRNPRSPPPPLPPRLSLHKTLGALHAPEACPSSLFSEQHSNPPKSSLQTACMVKDGVAYVMGPAAQRSTATLPASAPAVTLPSSHSHANARAAPTSRALRSAH